MAVTQTELQSFNEFAQQKVSNGGVDSMRQLFRQWLDACETEEVVRAVRAGEAEIAAGGGQPVAEVFAEIRQKMRWR